MMRSNNARLAVTPGRLRSGVTTIAGAGLMVAVGNAFLPGASRSRFGSQALTAPFGSAPEGYVHPQAWILPQKPGSLKVYPAAQVTVTAAANLNIGRPLAGDVTVDFTTSANLDMVVAFSGSATIDFTVAASLDGIVNVSGDATIDFSPTASLDMLVALVGSSPFSFTLSGSQSGVTSLTGSITPFTELSPQNLAASVWSALTGDYDAAGTFGAAMAAAGSAGDPWSTTLPGAYTDEQAGAIIYLVQQLLRNKVKTDPASGTMTVYDDDGVSILFTAPIFNDAHGADPYDGTAGINLKDRLE